MKFFKATGVILLFTLMAWTQVLSQSYKKDSIPPAIGHVNDFENIFSKKQERYLDSMIRSFEKRTTIEIAILTIDTMMISKENFDEYILKIANSWGVGQKGENNGITIGFSKHYRHIRIATGYGIEKLMSDAETKTIMDTTFIPYFKKGQYFQGTVTGLKAIMKKLK